MIEAIIVFLVSLLAAIGIVALVRVYFYNEYKRRKRGEPLRSEIPTGEHLYRPSPQFELEEMRQELKREIDELRRERRSMTPPGDE